MATTGDLLSRAVKVVFVLLVAAASVAYYLAAPKGSPTHDQLSSTGEADADTLGCGRPIAATPPSWAISSPVASPPTTTGDE